MHKLLSFIFICFLTYGLNAQSSDFLEQLDSIQKLRRLVKSEELSLETRIDYAKRAVSLSEITKIDSTVLYSNEKLVWVYLEDVKYAKQSKKLLFKNLELANKLNDKITYAYINHELGCLYHMSETQNDSAYYYYYKALKLYNSIPNSNTKESILLQVNTLFNIGNLQKDEQDYINCETTTIKAIELILEHPTNKTLNILPDLYAFLGQNLVKLKQYNKALQYFYNSMEEKNSKYNYEDILFIKINIAEIYKETEKYQKVYKIYNKLLNDKNLSKKDPHNYAIIINNIAYTMFLDKNKNTSKTDSLFIKAHRIFEDLQLHYEISAGSNDMSEFYASIEEKEKALFYAQKAYKTSKDIQEYEEQLRALLQLSKLKKGGAGKKYLYEYIKLNDSLINNERVNRNKFARIQFETDEYIKETKRLNTQNILISTIAGTVILILGLLYFIKRQNSKNNQLIFESEQQRSNQEIYNLLLNQQTKLEEGRLLERHRIAEDMHDGILSHLFGTRMGLGFLDIKSDNNTLNKYDKFINELQKVEDDIRNVSHELKKDAIFSKNNFKTITEQFLEQQSHLGHFKYEIIKDTPSVFEHIHDDNKVAIYRILQESIQNIIKHAKANKITFNFSLSTNALKLIIKDNGIGFNTEKKHQGIGIKNINSRVTKLDGTLKIESKINVGTTIRISIPNIKPLNKQDA